MIAFSQYYNFSAEDVECIEVTTVESADFPYRLVVHLKSGKQLSVSYKDSKSRDNAKLEMVRQVERQRRSDLEQIFSLFHSLRYTVERIDKRELRIWRQLRDLLGIRVEEDS